MDITLFSFRIPIICVGMPKVKRAATDFVSHLRLFQLITPTDPRVQALLGFLGDGGHHGGLILAVGHAVPLIGALEHGDCRLALIDELAGHGGQEILALEGVLGRILTQPARKAAIGLVQEALAEAPQVHADGRFHRQVIRALTDKSGAADAAS